MTETDGTRGVGMPAAPAAPAAPARILVVDDEPGVLHVARRILARRYTVTGASSGPEAIEILAREPHDLAIVDVRMPNMNGFELLKVIKNAHPDTEVIIGCHSIGNTGHGSGPSMATWQARQSMFTLQPSNMIAFEFFAWTPAPEWGGKKVRIPLEDDAIVTERGVEWLAPVNERILLIKQ